MTKSVLTGMAVCVALAVFAGNASAHVRKPIHRPHAQALSSLSVYRPYAQTWSSLTASQTIDG
jgi:hypothetical protein